MNYTYWIIGSLILCAIAWCIDAYFRMKREQAWEAEQLAERERQARVQELRRAALLDKNVTRSLHSVGGFKSTAPTAKTAARQTHTQDSAAIADSLILHSMLSSSVACSQSSDSGSSSCDSGSSGGSD